MMNEPFTLSGAELRAYSRCGPGTYVFIREIGQTELRFYAHDSGGGIGASPTNDERRYLNEHREAVRKILNGVGA